MSNIPLTDLRELRVGNIVTASYPPQWEESGLINEHEITPEDFADKNVSFYGISITEEWLERFGYKKQVVYGADIFYHPETPNYFIENDIYWWIYTGGLHSEHREEWFVCSKAFLYVHELQNCFYFLTGTELTLKQ